MYLVPGKRNAAAPDGTVSESVLLEDKALTIETEPNCGLVFLTLCGVMGEDGQMVDVGFDLGPETVMALSVALAKAAFRAATAKAVEKQPAECDCGTPGA